jgi:hypothetical protein
MRRRGSGSGRDLPTGHGEERGWAHSNGKTTTERLVVVAEAAVAGAERQELIGGEVLRARDGNGSAARFEANEEAREELRDALSTTGSAP